MQSNTSMAVFFDTVGRLPFPGDNVAIATSDLEAGTFIQFKDRVFSLSHSVLEGHRFAITRIEKGDSLLSWGMPFGKAITDIEPGHYICNDGVIEALKGRKIDIQLPEKANFTDAIPSFQFDTASFDPAPATSPKPVSYYFEGYRRKGRPGVGTRNYIVLLGVSSRVAGFVKLLEKECKSMTDGYNRVDGIVAVAHTEGDDVEVHNKELVLRTLAGFIVHPNTAAVLIVDDGTEAITHKDLEGYLKKYEYPTDSLSHAFLSLGGRFKEKLAEARQYVLDWLPVVQQQQRSLCPISDLNIALQCGGSDAFSGISGNPLASWVAREVIQQGGRANLAETDELIGAEPYVLKKVRDLDTAERFLRTIDRFVKRAERHGSSAAGNPSGGNKYRGLYNIYLKSLGAAMKKHPEVRLDAVIEYGELMAAPGFYFMDSPGNDLESIAGQVASGCNLIFFVTGNGSITNFPFVPTLKIVTTTERYHLLEEEMDINAGAYLDGTPMDALGETMMVQTLKTASGMYTVGERAGHAQVQLWRNWKQETKKEPIQENVFVEDPLYSGKPVQVLGKNEFFGEEGSIHCFESHSGFSPDRLGLVLPTSLCAGQVARIAVDKLNKELAPVQPGIDRYITLVHTEGCGVSGGASEQLFVRTILGHLTHPSVQMALLLEHGCEKTHNDFFRSSLLRNKINPDSFGWASIQLGGGIQRVLEYITDWFSTKGEGLDPATKTKGGLDRLRLGIVADQDDISVNPVLAELIRTVVQSGGTVVLPVSRSASLSKESSTFQLFNQLGVKGGNPTLAYGQRVIQAGMHSMEVPSTNWQESITGLGATSVNCILYYGVNTARPGHPFIPTLQVTAEREIPYAEEIDFVLRSNDNPMKELLDLITKTVSGDYVPVRMRSQNVDFQITRGLYGISL